jgi:TonB-dependent starch-binding outer membrane protein SusC
MQKNATSWANPVRSWLMFFLTNCTRQVRDCLTTQTLLAMKLTFLLLTAAFLNVSGKGIAQSVSLSGKNVPLQSIFKAIKQQTGYMVVYAREVLENAKPVTVDVKDMGLLSFLDLIFKDQPVQYTIDQKTILISEKPDSKTGVSFRPPAPVPDSTKFPVTGTVTDATGKPMGGATIIVKGKQAAVTTTDAEGKFTIQAFLNDVITVSFVGYEVKSMKVKGSGEAILFLLKPVASELDDVEIVSTGYQTLPRERATGSFGVVTAKMLAKIPSTSLFDRLMGQVSGVDISTATVARQTRSGSIKIRGYSTIPGYTDQTKVSLDPLLVIDGFPSQRSISAGALDYLNPDDIEQITFLKDAAAASIWGMQAANGVIVVTTKKGVRNTKPVINFSATYGTSARPRMDYYPINTSAQYIDLEKEHIDKGVFNDPVTRSNPGSFYPENNSQAQWIYWRYKRGEITEAQMNTLLDSLGQLDNRSQISKYLLQPSSTQQYNISISGGGPGSAFYFSGYYYQDDPVYKSNRNRGVSINAGNTTTFLNGKLIFTTGLTYSNKRDKLNQAAITALNTSRGGLRPYDMLKDANGNNKYYDVMVIPTLARYLESRGYLPFSYSPIDELNYSNSIQHGNNVTLNLGMNANITNWLSVNLNGNIGRLFEESETYNEPDSYVARAFVNQATGLFPTSITNGYPKGGIQRVSNSQGKTYNLRGTIAVNKNWNNKHQLNVIVGAEVRESFNKNSTETRYGVDKSINASRAVSIGASYRDINSSNQTIAVNYTPVSEFTTRSLSYYGNGSYTFQGKYTLSASARFDDFNLLGVERRKRAVPLWSSGLKWNIGKESFMRHLPWLDNLVARGTVGFSGNAPQGYAPVTVVNLLGNEFYSGLPYGNISSPAIDNLSWEKTRMINVALDYSVLKNRVYGSAEFYYKKSTDIIWSMPINATYGFASLLFNTANLDGKGVDLSLSGVPVLTKNWRWTTTLNLSYNTNIIKDYRFKQPVIAFDSRTLYEGYPIDYVFSYKWAGLDSNGQSLIRSQDGKTIHPASEFLFKDIREYSGRSASPWFGGFINSVSYKGFELSAYFSFNFGGVFRKPSANDIGFSNSGFVGRNADIDKRWRKKGDEAFTNVPGLYYGINANLNQSLLRYQESDFLIRSRSNIKCRQVSLSYTIPAAFATRIGLKNLTVSGAARELGLVWAKNKEGLDPEYLYTKGDGFQLPPSVKYTFRIAASF